MTRPQWTTADDVRAHVGRQWARGRLLAPLAVADDSFPMRLPLKTPTASELAARFDEVRAWIAAARAIRHVRLVWRTLNHRQLGANEVPAELWLDSVEDAAAVLGRGADVRRFRQIVGVTTARRPELVPLLARRPLDVLAAGEAWERMLDVTDWVMAHPRPGIYVRQVDLAGVDTKFVEQHQRLLAMMFDIALPEEAIDRAARRGEFARRYGFRLRPRLVRFRSLDQRRRLTQFDVDGQYLLTAADFARVPPPARVFVTENEINFLAFPDAADSIVVFGAGSGLEHLAEAAWLANVPLHYWGDIDTHGFAILDQLRAVAPHARSMLMDRDTLMSHRRYWGLEQEPAKRDLFRLVPDEQALYDDLRDHRIRANLRLEQERIRFGRVRSAVADLVAGIEEVP